MAEILMEKDVLFPGIWRPSHHMDDAFMRMVSQQFQERAGAKAVWRLTREGLTIVVRQSETGRQGQVDQIPAQAIKEVTVNRYNGLCLMTVFVDPARRFNVLVCRCTTEQDAADIVNVFRQLQKSLSGEGFRIDLKRPQGLNWTLKTKQQNGGGGGGGGGEAGNGPLNGHSSASTSENGEPRSPAAAKNGDDDNNDGDDDTFWLQHPLVEMETEEEALEREPVDVQGRHCFSVGVQAQRGGTDDDLDLASLSSDVSYQSLKDEIVSLSNEVRDIKLLLEQTTGISAEEFFRRRREGEVNVLGRPTLVPVKRPVPPSPDTPDSPKHVNFAAPQSAGGGAHGQGHNEVDMDFDIRSVGMQAGGSGMGSSRSRSLGSKFIKRARHALTPSRYQLRSRSSSGSSQQNSPGGPQPSPLSPYSPLSPGPFPQHHHQQQRHSQNGQVFVYGGGDHHQKVQLRESRHGSASGRRHQPVVFSSGGGLGMGAGGGGGTVVKPIESVYHVHTPGFHHKRNQVIVMPNRSASVPPRHPRVTSSGSAPPRGEGVTHAPVRGSPYGSSHPPSPVSPHAVASNGAVSANH